MSDHGTGGVPPMHASLAHALEDLHARMAETVLELGPDALDWRAAPGLPTVRELVVKAAAAERHWLTHCVLSDMVDGTPVSDKDTEGSDHPLYALGFTGQMSQTVLAALPPAKWIEPRRVDGVEMSVAGCVLKNLDALAQVLGQIELLANLWAFRTQNQPGSE